MKDILQLLHKSEGKHRDKKHARQSDNGTLNHINKISDPQTQESVSE